MAIETTWDDQFPGILIETYTGVWIIEDSRRVWLVEQQALRERNGPIDVIILMDDLHLPLSGMRHFAEVSRSPLFTNTRLGIAALVGLKPTDQPIYDTFTRIYPSLAHKIPLAESVDQARAMILSRRQAA